MGLVCSAHRKMWRRIRPIPKLRATSARRVRTSSRGTLDDKEAAPISSNYSGSIQAFSEIRWWWKTTGQLETANSLLTIMRFFRRFQLANSACHSNVMFTSSFKLSGRALLAVGPLLAFAAVNRAEAQTPPSPLEDQVRHELLKLPYYRVFDYLPFSVDVDAVTLSGQASNYVLRRDALSAMKHLAGVKTVNDQIEVLPLSQFDDNIRLRLFRSIYRDSALNRYRLIRVQPPIRILVNNGNITLKGVVDSEMDRNVIYDRAMEVRDAFSVTDDLTVQ